MFPRGPVIFLLISAWIGPAFAILFGGGPSPAFKGNPNTAITAINTVGGITASRTTCKTPCFVQVSASAITAMGTGVPFQDLSYSWNFGDPTGSEVFSNSAIYPYDDSARVNANSTQIGPEAAYAYRSAGTYTVTLTIKGKNGSNFISATVTRNVTVSAFVPTATWYYDQNATGANNGTNATDAFTDITTITAKVSATTPTQIYLANGSHWTGNYHIGIQAPFNSVGTGLRIASYVPAGGSTTRPVIEASAGSQTLVSVTNGGASVWCAFDDIVISNIDLVVSGATYSGDGILTAAASGSSDSRAVLSNIYFDNVKTTSNLSVSRALQSVGFGYSTVNAGGLFINAGIWGGSVNSAVGDLAHGNSIGGGTTSFCFVVGVSNINGNGIGGVTEHHMYMYVQQHALFRWINMGQGSGRNYSIKVDWYPTPKQNILGTAAGAGGVVRVQIADTSQFTTGTQMYVEDVDGTTEINNAAWVGTIIDSTHIDLAGTTFVHAWTSGGDISPGGNTAAAVARYWLVDSNNITGTNRAVDASNNHGTTQSSNVTDYVIQGNAIHDLLADAALLLPVALNTTVRYNNFWNNLTRVLSPSQGLFPPDTNGVFRLYFNNFYVPASVSGGTRDTAAVTFVGNGSTTWANAQTFTDNVIQDMRTGASAIALDSYGEWVSLGSVVDRNSYYVPNASPNQFTYNNNSRTAFGPSGTAGTWQNSGFDLNGSTAQTINSNWPNPSIGDFGP